MILPPPRSTLFPYTTLFRSAVLLESKQMQSSMKQEGWFKRCAALSAFLVMTAATSAAQVKPRMLKAQRDRKSTRLNSSHANISYAVFCLKKKKKKKKSNTIT